MTLKEREVQKFMQLLGLTRTEALQLWADDHREEELPIQREYREKAEINGLLPYVTAVNSTKQQPEDSDKQLILAKLKKIFGGKISGAKLQFPHGEEIFTIKVIRNRKK